jgi:hypothetical protein
MHKADRESMTQTLMQGVETVEGDIPFS